MNAAGRSPLEGPGKQCEPRVIAVAVATFEVVLRVPDALPTIAAPARHFSYA